ncbi:MAG: aminotransferase class I/II-fold pyridoxal phosphate-dependent enzyme [Hyphomicrobiaceae bacterium]|nr:aminotransferase class I/II-fold pyridoxal phosphate-dependent enzyme [Hyphomicrobiaceae bacterium]
MIKDGGDGDDLLRGVFGTPPATETPSLLDRLERDHRWFERRLAARLDPYQRCVTTAIGPRVRGHFRNGQPFSGINFAAQDYLSLTRHPRIIRAGRRALHTYGSHSAGPMQSGGLHPLAIELEHALAAFLGYADVTVTTLGWLAGYAAVTALVGPDDIVLLDSRSNSCLFANARSAGGRVETYRHCSTADAQRMLESLRASNPDAGILLITEAIFPTCSDMPDIAALQRLCRSHGASLMVDVSTDLGAWGERGGGQLQDQYLRGKVDVVVGTFSNTFAALGGFVASNSAALKTHIRCSPGPATQTSGIPPIQAATALEALAVVDSREGDERREMLKHNVLYARYRLAAAGFELGGSCSPSIPVKLGQSDFARLATREIIELGGIVNLLEFPTVPPESCRWRLSMMADHSEADIDEFVVKAALARNRAKLALESYERD